MGKTEFYFRFKKSTHYSMKMDWKKEMSVGCRMESRGEMTVTLELGSDTDIQKKKSALIPEIIRG